MNAPGYYRDHDEASEEGEIMADDQSDHEDDAIEGEDLDDNLEE